MISEKLPMFYQNPVPLNTTSHADMTVSPSPQGYFFAASAQIILLATAEFFDAGRQFPILFTSTANGQMLPVALMGLESGENLFVSPHGTWLGQYIPAYVRRYPFITTDNSEGQVTVCFDEGFDGLNQPGGTALFEGGEPTGKLQEIQAFLADYNTQMQLTEQFGAVLAQAGLLRQIELRSAVGNGHAWQLSGLLVVDEQKLAQLPDTDIVKLFRTGMMALIHAHLLSLRTIDGLVERAVAKRAAHA